MGDLHVENFGTWLAPAGEAFGVILAAHEGHLGLGPKDIAGHLWSGYGANSTASAAVSLDDGGVPLVDAVAAMWRASQSGPKRFWKGIDKLPEAPRKDLPPPPAPGFVLRTPRTHIAGLGSRDHPRLVLDGELGGERAVFERKPLAPAAARFLAGADPTPDPRPHANLLRRQDELSPSLRAQVRVDGAAVVRRLEHAAGRLVVAADHAGFRKHVTARGRLGG